MSKRNSDDVTRKRFAKWYESAKSTQQVPVWTERRLAIDIGGHTYIIGNGQIFQCPHCGHYDPEWTATEVLAFYKEHMGIEPREIEVTCTVTPPVAEVPK